MIWFPLNGVTWLNILICAASVNTQKSARNHYSKQKGLIMDQIEKEVIEWHKSIFPNATDDAISQKFREESYEFEIESQKYRDFFSATATEEFADMCIVYMGGLAKRGKPTLTEIIRCKLDINKARVWGPENKDGSRYREK